MSVDFFKPRQRWRYDFERKGKRYCGYCLDENGQPVKSERAARDAEAREKLRVAMESKVARGPDVSLATVIKDCLPGWQENKKNWPNTQVYLRAILEFEKFKKGEVPMAAISEADVDDYVLWLAKKPLRIWKGGSRKTDCEGAERLWQDAKDGRTIKASTVDRYLHTLRDIFTRAYKTRDPVTGEWLIAEKMVIAGLAKGPRKRKGRPVPETVLAEVLHMLPPHVCEALVLTRAFGTRRREVFSLEIKDFEFGRGRWGGIVLDFDRVKNGEDTFMPGGWIAMEFIHRLIEQAQARGQTHLITYRQSESEDWRLIKSAKRAWATAMEKIEAKYGKRWRWHDIRAAFISGIANDPTSTPLVAQKLARHADFRTTQMYVDVESSLVMDAADSASDRAFGVVELAAKKAESRTKSRTESRTGELVVGPKRLKSLK